jgi:adenylate cyclase
VGSRALTKGTEIAALEAQRNELEVRAEGALLGERRAAIARLVMVLLFGLLNALDSPNPSPTPMYVGMGYAAYALGLLISVHVHKRSRPRLARWLPLVVTTIDYAFLTTEGMLATAFDGFHPGQHALSTALVMSFAVARLSLWHVVFALGCAEVSWVIASSDGHAATEFPTLFVEGGLAVIAFVLAMTNRALGGMFHGLRQRDNLTRFLPRQVAERVIAAGPMALAPVQRDVTVLFSDIRGFTGMAETLAPRELLAMLDDYFGRMGQVVKGHDGVIGKFLGDGLLAFWGVPDLIDDHARRAVRAACDMRRVLIEINRDRERTGQAAIQIGIGIHTGVVAAGMLGGQLQSEYTVIGDAVNVASRIEGLTKDHRVDLLISETTHAQLDHAGTRARRVGEGAIRGRKEAVVLYTIDADAADRGPLSDDRRAGS